MENFQEASKVEEKNEDETVKLIHDPEEASRKWSSTTKFNTNGTEAGPPC